MLCLGRYLIIITLVISKVHNKKSHSKIRKSLYRNRNRQPTQPTQPTTTEATTPEMTKPEIRRGDYSLI